MLNAMIHTTTRTSQAGSGTCQRQPTRTPSKPNSPGVDEATIDTQRALCGERRRDDTAVPAKPNPRSS